MTCTIAPMHSLSTPDRVPAGGNRLPFLGARELMDLLGYAGAVDALERAFARRDDAPSIERERHVVDGGDLLVMPAAGPEGVGVKLVTVAPGNAVAGLPLIHGMYVLFSSGSMQPEALVDGAALTALRTAAVSALATKHLARPDAHRLVVFGAGAQAAAHAAAMPAVRPIDDIRIVGRDRERVRALVAELNAAGLPAQAGRPDAVASADVVCTCTTSAAPVFDGGDLAPGAHVNAIGAYRQDMRELDAALIARATLVVEERAAALAEAGDIIQAVGEGAIEPDHVDVELGEVVRGERGRRSPEETTVFKSVGLAFEDLVVVRAAVERASETDRQALDGARSS